MKKKDMSFIVSNIKELLSELPSQTKLVAVSKTYDASCIQQAYDFGHRMFGESRPQELKEKEAILPKDIEWHMIGNLQRNKVKYIAPFVALIHSVDSLSLLKEIEKEGRKNDRVLSFLLQLKVAQEDTKNGLSLEQARELLLSEEYRKMQYVNCCGIMGMATFTENIVIVGEEFALLKKQFDVLKQEFFSHTVDFKEISMGMSADYPIAIEKGSTLVRIGSQIFGKR